MSGKSFDDLLFARLGVAAAHWSPTARPSSMEAVTKGSSSLTYAVDLSDESGNKIHAYVKVAPPDLPPVRNRDMLRQAAVLRVLGREGSVPVPRLLFEDGGSPPSEPPFFVTELAVGSALEPLVDDSQLPPAQELAARVLGAAETLARLHRVGSNDLREYSGDSASEFADLEFEVRRWARVFSTVDLDLNGADEVCAMRLLAKTPKPLRRSIVHGDFRLGNIVCDGGHVIAVLDWEIWSLTDPRIDVGWFLMTLSADGLPSAIRTSAPGLPSPEEALSVYETAIETKLADLSWFGALSRFRAAAAMSLNIKHNRRRPTPDPRIESYAGKLPEFLALASDLIA